MRRETIKLYCARKSVSRTGELEKSLRKNATRNFSFDTLVCALCRNVVLNLERSKGHEGERS